MILTTTAGTSHDLNCFGYVIEAPQTSFYQNKYNKHLPPFAVLLFSVNTNNDEHRLGRIFFLTSFADDIALLIFMFDLEQLSRSVS